MSDSFYAFENLSTKVGFNNTLSHFQSVTGIIEEFNSLRNLADILNEMLIDKKINQNQILPTVYALLKDKYNYSYFSLNLKNTIEDFDKLYKEVSKWKAIDIVLLYQHPDLGPVLINPKNKKHLDSLNLLKNFELLTIYAGTFYNEDRKNLGQKSINALLKYFEGKKFPKSDIFTKGNYKFIENMNKSGKKSKQVKKPVKKTTRSVKRTTSTPVKNEKLSQEENNISTSGRMTPFYSVPVTNELFHNGNVEAWKKIIQSYNKKHPNLEVFIYYDGERIHDIHSLFKWGKVKHGSTILFAVKGENIKDVAKLQRYFKQGASPMFEAFLKFPVNTILNLF